MSVKLVWDEVGKRLYEAGVSKGVLYVRDVTGLYPKGAAWNGLISVTESPSGAEATPQYADNIQYLNLVSSEKFGATIEAFTYPDEFEACQGAVEAANGVYVTQQKRSTFGLCYRTEIGSDVDDLEHGYKLHLVYGAVVAPSEKGHQTINESVEAMNMSWEISTTPVAVKDLRPTAHLVVDSTKTDPAKLAQLETILYGTAAVTEPSTPAVEARLPLPDEVITLIGPVVAG